MSCNSCNGCNNNETKWVVWFEAALIGAVPVAKKFLILLLHTSSSTKTAERLGSVHLGQLTSHVKLANFTDWKTYDTPGGYEREIQKSYSELRTILTVFFFLIFQCLCRYVSGKHIDYSY